MKRKIVRTILFSATLLLSLPGLASAQDAGACANFSLAGAWGVSWSGTLMLPTGAAPAAAVGMVTGDDSNHTGIVTSSVGGNVGTPEKDNGTWTLNPDCTGTITVTVYAPSGNIDRQATWFLVMDDNGNEIRAIMTSLQRGGTNVPAIVTMTCRRLSPVAAISS